MSASFHGRDWFVPVAARWSGGADLELTPVDSADLVGSDWPTELPAVLYVDRFGNLMTGLQAADRPRTGSLLAGARTLPYARTFCEVARGNGFWYENALGLVEIAVNQGRADRALGLSPGDPVGPFLPPD
jgi:S-adenosylmethionine hydrolase